MIYVLLMALPGYGSGITGTEFLDRAACEEAGRQFESQAVAFRYSKTLWICQPKGTLPAGTPEAIAHEKALLAREKARVK